MVPPKYFICPMSKNIVDVVLELNSTEIGLLPSRRQIDYDGGYVNNWNSESFAKYVHEKSQTLIQRDHAGIGQNTNDHLMSYGEDVKWFDIIHVDPWKEYDNLEDGTKETINNIKFIHGINPNIKIEVGTEEAIRKFTIDELKWFINHLKEHLTNHEFNSILFVCVQSGVGLDLINRRNIGKFSEERLSEMVDLVKSYGLRTKEHNGDYLDEIEIKNRFNGGLDSLNIGPEIVQLETEMYLEYMTSKQIDDFYKICLQSGKWKKWVTNDFNQENKTQLIMVCGHYCYCYTNLPDINDIIKMKLKNKFKQLIEYVG